MSRKRKERRAGGKRRRAGSGDAGSRKPSAVESTGKLPLRGVFAVDLRALAAFRVALAVVLLVDLAIRASDLGAMYTDDGMFSRATIGRHFSAWSWSFHFASGSAAYQAILFGLAGVCAAALLVGYETRLATVGSWLLLISLHNRVPHILSGADNLARMLLFWGMFLPLGGAWSFDARRARREGVQSAGTGRVLSVASAAILLQVAFVYLFSAVFKSNADWFEGEALAAILPDAFYGKPFARGLLAFPAVLSALTVAILSVEWLAPFLLFSPFRTGAVRLYVVGVLASMHLGIELVMNVGLFSFVSLAGLVLFLPTSFWDRLPARVARITDDTPPRATADRLPAAPAPSLGALAARGACALALAFVVFANVNGLPDRFLPWASVPRIELLTVSFGLGQKWDMFAEAPSRNGWYVARATLADGTHVDLLREGAPIDWKRPHDPTAVYPNHRWRKCFREMSYADERGYQVFREPVAEYLCRAWDRTRAPARNVSDFSLVFCMETDDEIEIGLDPSPALIRENLVRLDFSGRDAAP